MKNLTTWAVAFAAVLIPVSGLLSAASVEAASLTVTIRDIQPGPGHIRVVLYADPDSFRHEERAFRVIACPADAATSTATFADVPPGRYAVIAYHDANDNHKLDMRLGMFPEEGWGLSNDPTVIGPPRFSASAFGVTEPNTNLPIRLSY